MKPPSAATRLAHGAIILLLSVTPALAAVTPIAITEVHSSQSTNGTTTLKADWWELTNFASTPVDVNGYRFNDATGGLATGAVTIDGLVLAPGESVVFLEQSASTSQPSADDFRRWWGAALPASVRIFSYSTNGIGLGSGGDSLTLWSPAATSDADAISRVEFGAATPGISFTFDPATGLFGLPTAPASAGAITAEEGADVASPGRTTGSVPLRIVGEPQDQEVNPGDTVTFTVGAEGMPQPQFRWRFRGVELPGATGPTLTVSNASPAVAGSYQVHLDNGLTTTTSRIATLSIREQPTAPVFTLTPTNLVVLKGGTAILSAAATGVPQPTYAWFRNGSPIPGADAPTLTRTNVTEADAGEYRVTASNPAGSVSATASLAIRGKPNLRITEVHSASTETTDPDFARRIGLLRARAECECATPETDRIQALSFAQEDWLEITSFESSPVNLTGWRLDDNSGRIANAYTLTNEVVLHPGESVILMERLTPEQFQAWWGTNQLPAGLQMITYTGSGLGLSSGGDGLRLWDAETTTDSDTVLSVDFPAGTPGVSFNFNPDTLEFGAPSEAGVHGVYQAPGSIDAELNQTYLNLGSPGRIRAGDVVIPPTLSVEQATNARIRIRFPATAGRTYELQGRQDATSGSWSASGSPLTPAATGPAEFLVPVEAASSRFFRVLIR